MKLPDWFIYTVALAAVLYTLFANSESNDAPPAVPEDIQLPDVTLPLPSIFDEEVLVELEETDSPSIGTAFSVGREGMWLTARHVVDGCSDLAVQVGNSRIVPVTRYETAASADLALLYTDGGPEPTVLDLEEELRVGQQGYHIGYPQGRAGEVSSRLLSRSVLRTTGRYQSSEPVIAWAESGRTRNLMGTLGGMSGGPLFNENGEVIGVTVAESPRRGRIYTAAPTSLQSFLNAEADLMLDGEQTRSLSADNYGGEGDRLRRNLTIVKVLCRARD